MSLTSPEEPQPSQAERLLGQPGVRVRYDRHRGEIMNSFILFGQRTGNIIRQRWSGVTADGDCVEVMEYMPDNRGFNDTYLAYIFSLERLAETSPDEEFELPSPRSGERGTWQEAPRGAFRLVLSDPTVEPGEDTLILPIHDEGPAIIYNSRPAVSVEDASRGAFPTVSP